LGSVEGVRMRRILKTFLLSDSPHPGPCPARRWSALRFPKTALEPLLAPDIYRTVLNTMTDQIKAIKMGRVAINFTPRHVAYETETNRVFVSSELKSQGTSSKPDIKPRTYEFIIAIKNLRPRLEFIDVYPDADSQTDSPAREIHLGLDKEQPRVSGY
jgi:hypothetical protein